MTNIISITIKQPLVDEVDKLREICNIKRSKFISKILEYVCNDNNLFQEIFKEELIE